MWQLAKISKTNEETQIEELNNCDTDIINKLILARNDVMKIFIPKTIIKNWNIAYSFFKTNLPVLLNESAFQNQDFINYHIKIVLYAGYEFIETSKRYLINLFPNKIKKENKNNKVEELSEGEWILKDLSGKIYDKNFSYRLCYNLRNCLQHVGAEGIIIEHSNNGYNVKLNRLEYLERHSGINKEFKNELMAMQNDSFGLISLIEQYNENILALHNLISSKCSCKEIGQELYASLIIQKYLGQYENNETALVDKDDCTLKYQVIDIKRALEYVKMYCRYFIESIKNDDINRFPSQICDNFSILGRIKNVTYIKLFEEIKDDKNRAIYILKNLSLPAREEALKAVIRFIGV